MQLNLVPRSLHYIEAVAEHGSIQAAARATGISASAIDRQVKLVEDRLGVRLFDRNARGMQLSPAGEMFVLLAQRWRADERRIQSDVKRMQGVDFGHIRLATMDSLVNGLIPEFLRRVGRDYPRVRVDVEVATPDDAAERLERIPAVGRAVRAQAAKVIAEAPVERGIVFINLHLLDLFDKQLTSAFAPLPPAV